jgi:hypothetical protein
MAHVDPQQYPVVFLSYDEPNADSNYEHLVRQRPDSLRVHGVKGSDQAHKACAELAGTDRFFTVDGDTRVDAGFWRCQHDLGTVTDWDDSVLSFSSRNVVNGLCYGNGGIKLWPSHIVRTMKTHELSEDPESATDFCWALDYVLMPGVWSQTQINGTEYQAWRAGFREGVKFTQIDGCECKDANLWQNSIAEVNARRLCLWQQLGMDVRHGAWSILGARQGFVWALFTDWDIKDLQDFDLLNNIFDQHCRFDSMDRIQAEIRRFGREILDGLYLDITETALVPDHSRWTKKMWPCEPRTQAKRLRS